MMQIKRRRSKSISNMKETMISIDWIIDNYIINDGDDGINETMYTRQKTLIN